MEKYTLYGALSDDVLDGYFEGVLGGRDAALRACVAIRDEFEAKQIMVRDYMQQHKIKSTGRYKTIRCTHRRFARELRWVLRGDVRVGCFVRHWMLPKKEKPKCLLLEKMEDADMLLREYIGRYGN